MKVNNSKATEPASVSSYKPRWADFYLPFSCLTSQQDFIIDVFNINVATARFSPRENSVKLFVPV